MEIERKFLVKRLPPGWKAASGLGIRQGYFRLRNKDVEIRIRKIGSQCFITIKAGRGRMRLEEEMKITRQRFEKLWPLVRATSITKTRYRISHAGRTIELDVYEGRHRGLMTAEVEFSSLRDSDRFEPPLWLEREVTGNQRYANASLAQRRRV